MAWESASGTSLLPPQNLPQCLIPSTSCIARNSSKIHGMIYPKQWLRLAAFPGLAKQRHSPTCRCLTRANSFCGRRGNVQQGLPVAVNKEAAKGMCRHFLRSTRRDQKRLTAWFGQLRLTLSCDRVTVGDSPIWWGLRKDEMGAFLCQCTWVGTRAGIFWPSVPSNLRSDQKLNLSQKPTRFSLEMFN